MCPPPSLSLENASENLTEKILERERKKGFWKATKLTFLLFEFRVFEERRGAGEPRHSRPEKSLFTP